MRAGRSLRAGSVGRGFLARPRYPRNSTSAIANRRNVGVTQDMGTRAALIPTNARPQKRTRRTIEAGRVQRGADESPAATAAEAGSPVKREAPRGGAARGPRVAEDPSRELPLPALQELRVVRVLDPYVVRRAHGRLPVQELREVLPA